MDETTHGLSWRKRLRRVVALAAQGCFRAAAWLIARVRGIGRHDPAYQSWITRAWDEYLRERDRVGPLAAERLECPGAVASLASIVLPVHNGERYLTEAIQSIQQQSYSHWELIIVDDGSTDRSAKIAESFAASDERIRVLRQENRGLPQALNAGFALASGEFLTWTSDDNRLKPVFLEKLVHELIAQPSADMVYANYEIIDEVGYVLRGSAFCAALQSPPGSGRIHLWRDVSSLNLINGNFIGPAFLFRARTWRLLGGFSPHWFTCEDYDYAMRINEELILRHVGFTDCIYEYRLHEAALSARQDEAARVRLTDRLLVFDDFRRSLVHWPAWWLVSHDESPAGRAAAAEFGQLVQRANHLLVLEEQGQNYPLVRQLEDGNVFRICARVRFAVEKIIVQDHRIPCWQIIPQASAPNKNFSLFSPASSTEPLFISSEISLFWRAIWVMLRQRIAANLENELPRARTETNRPELSIIVCSNRTTPTMQDILSALASEIESTKAELLIVDNRSEGMANVFAQTWQQVGGRSEIRVIPALRPGLAFARNLGLAAARGEWIAYLDDDTIPEPDWLNALKTSIEQHPIFEVIGGAIAVRDPDPPPWWWRRQARRYWAEYHARAGEFHQVREWRQFPHGGNWAAHREALLRIGGFRENFGHRADRVGAGEEVLAALQIQRTGGKIGVEPRARVLHCVDRRRFTLRNLWRTLREGWRVRLRLEQGLYIDRVTSPLGQIKDALVYGGSALIQPRLNRFQRIERLLWAVVSLLLLKDFFIWQLGRLRRLKV